MDMAMSEVIRALSKIWKASAQHGDVPNAYIKTSTEPKIDIYLYATQGMELLRLGVQR